MPTPQRARAQADHPPAEAFLPARLTRSALAEAVQGCTACALYKDATQAVMGEGPRRAAVLLVGEQPGDQEDLQGRPFVGPAGRVLDEVLAAAGIDRAEVYLTNAVKHFKWEPRGTRRLHKKPAVGEVRACRPWLDAQLALIAPRGIVCLGATAAQAVLGPQLRITRDRGRFFDGSADGSFTGWVTATLHPSAILRMPDEERRNAAREQLIADLSQVARRLREA